MRSWRIGLSILIFTFSTSPVSGEDNSPARHKKNFEIHGFASQAWAKAWIDGPRDSLLFTNQPDLVFGIPESGTTKYQTLALQFRFRVAERSSVIVQLDYENAGDDLVVSERGIELDWAFFSHEFRNGIGVKIGRMPIPIGLFNEIRDVGVLLPFYRPVGAFYGEGNLHSSTIDGLLISKTFPAGEEWSLTMEGYFGGWDIPEVFSEPSQGLQVREARARDVIGAQFWLENSDASLRFGVGGNMHDGTGGVFRQQFGKTEHESWHASVEAKLGQLTGRAEYRFRSFGPLTSPRASFDSDFENFYFQLGYQFNESWALWLQWDSAVLETFVLPPQGLDQPSIQDPFEAAGPAIAVNYSFRPDLVLKAEYHHADRALTTTILPIDPPLIFGLRAEKQETRYSIVSLSYSF